MHSTLNESAASLDEVGAASLNESAASLDEAGAASLNESAVSLNEAGAASLNESAASLDEAASRTESRAAASSRSERSAAVPSWTERSIDPASLSERSEVPGDISERPKRGDWESRKGQDRGRTRHFGNTFLHAVSFLIIVVFFAQHCGSVFPSPFTQPFSGWKWVEMSFYSLGGWKCRGWKFRFIL